MPNPARAKYLLDYDEEVYTKILEIFPEEAADFDVDRWVESYKDLVPNDWLDRRIQQSIQKTGCEYSSSIEDVIPLGMTLANTDVTRRALISSSCVYAAQLPRWAFQKDLELKFGFGYYYSEPLPDRLPIRFGPRIREEMEILYMERDNDYSLSTLWRDIEQQCRGNFWFPHDRDIADYPDKIATLKYASCVSHFMRLLFTMNLPLSEIEAWYDSLSMKFCVGDLHQKGYMDCHFSQEPYLTSILFFLKLEKQEKQFKREGRALVPTGFNCVGIGLATGARDGQNEHSKKTRELVLSVLSSMGLLSAFLETDDYPFRPNIPGTFPPKLGKFVKAKQFIGSDVYKAIIGRLLSAASSHYGAAMGSPHDLVFYSAYNIKFLLTKHNVWSLFQTGYLAQQQYQVDYRLLRISRSGRQVIPDREWAKAINTTPNALQLYYDNPDNPRMNAKVNLPVVVPPFGQLFFGRALLENAKNYKFTATSGAPTARVPVLLDADVENDYAERLAEFWRFVPRRHRHDVVLPRDLARDPRDETLYDYAKKNY